MHDGIPWRLQSETAIAILASLANITNAIFKPGTFPSKLKIAKVTPVFENGEKQNYRPMAIISIVSKMIEKVLLNRLE